MSRALNRERSATSSDSSNDSGDLSLSCLVSSVESKDSEVQGDLETVEAQQRLHGTNLHALLLKMTLAYFKKYTTTYYYCKCAVWKLCDFVASNPGFLFRILYLFSKAVRENLEREAWVRS